MTTPVGCAAVFGVRPGPVRGKVTGLLDAWPAARALRAELLALGHDDPETSLARTEAVLLAGLDEADRGLERCAAAVAALEADPVRPIAAVAADLGVSPRTPGP